MDTNKDAMDIAENLQKEMHEYCDKVLKEKPHLDYDSVRTVYLLHKVGELTKRIIVLEQNDQFHHGKF